MNFSTPSSVQSAVGCEHQESDSTGTNEHTENQPSQKTSSKLLVCKESAISWVNGFVSAGVVSGEREVHGCMIQFIPLIDWVVVGSEGRFSKDSLPVFQWQAHLDQFWYGKALFDVVSPAAFSAGRGITHCVMLPEGRFRRGCHSCMVILRQELKERN